MIGYVTARRGRVLSENDITHLIRLSGGHAGLLKAILSLAWNRGYRSISGIEPARLLNEPSIRRECQKLWKSLSAGEQVHLCSFAGGELILRETLFGLIRRGLMRKTDRGPVVFSPVFGIFVAEQLPPPTKGTYVDCYSNIVQIAGKRISGLAPLETAALSCLYEAHGRVCTKDDLARSVYRQRYDDVKNGKGVTDEAIQTLIGRLRAKIEPDRSRPRYVVTVRGEGYRFVMPDGEP